MTAIELLVLLSFHFVADFLLQSDWMATRKSHDWIALLSHVYVYSTVMVLALIWIAPNGAPWLSIVYFYLITFATHFVTDAITSRATSRLFFFKLEPGTWRAEDGKSAANCAWFPVNKNRHWFFCMIGLDQLIHAWTLRLTYVWVLG